MPGWVGDKSMKKVIDKKTHNEISKDEHGEYVTDSALWEINGISFSKIDGWWNYERPDGLTNWEIDGGPFKTLKEAKAAALKSLENKPLANEAK
jgi:hypothetical protein